MGDEKVGPYKITAQHKKDTTVIQVVEERKDERFLVVVVPDAGTLETARRIVNAFNKAWREGRDDEADGTSE